MTFLNELKLIGFYEKISHYIKPQEFRVHDKLSSDNSNSLKTFKGPNFKSSVYFEQKKIYVGFLN